MSLPTCLKNDEIGKLIRTISDQYFLNLPIYQRALDVYTLDHATGKTVSISVLTFEALVKRDGQPRTKAEEPFSNLIHTFQDFIKEPK